MSIALGTPDLRSWRTIPTHATSLLQAALIGYQAERDRIEKAMADIRSQLGTKGAAKGGGAGPQPAPKKRRLSAAARKRIAAAQRKRWAEYKKRKNVA